MPEYPTKEEFEHYHNQEDSHFDVRESMDCIICDKVEVWYEFDENRDSE